MSDLLELRVIIRKQENANAAASAYIAVTEYGNGEALWSNTFQYDPSQVILRGPFEPRGIEKKVIPKIAEPQSHKKSPKHRRKRRGRSPQEKHAVQYGAKLFAYLFGKGKVFRDFLKAHKEPAAIRLCIVFTPNTAFLSGLLWEYLYGGKDFLCRKNIQIIRQYEDSPSIVPVPVPGPLRVLALISNPDDQGPLDMSGMDDELTCLQDALAPITHGTIELVVLSEVTIFTLRQALQETFYHVLYFVGYGKFNLMQKRSYLCFEDDVGNADWVGAPQFTKLLESKIPHLVILDGRTKVQMGVRDPYHSFALECIKLGIPAALTIPATMHPDSAEILNRTLFSALSAGHTVCESVSDMRNTLMDREEADGRANRFDWGTPACYVGAACVVPVSAPDELPGPDQNANPAAAIYRPPYFVGRKTELHNLRKALKDKVSVIYLWGRTGSGKNSVIDQLLFHTGVHLKGVLRVQCDTLREPLSVLSKISSFWADHQPAEHQQAADLLLDSRQDPFVRAQAAQEHLGKYHYLLIFENIDAWFSEPGAEISSEPAGTIAYPLIRSLLLGMLHAHANTTFLFTGERRWADLSSLPSADRREIPLPLLKPGFAYALMSTLPGVNSLSRQVLETVYWHMGGHPLAIKLLSGWLLLDQGHDLESLFRDPPVQDRSTTAWINYLLGEIIDHLDPGEAQVLPITAILNRPISAKVLPNLTLISAPYAGTLLNTWVNLGLIETTAVKGQYVFHQTVRNFILDRLPTSEYRHLHLLAAEYYGAPFVDEARRQIVTRNAGYQSDDRILWLARDINGILGAWLRQDQDKDRCQELVELAMAWHYHLFHAGEFEAAVQVARAIVPMLHRLGLRDLAGAVLQRAVSAAEGYNRAVGMDDYARIQVADGHLVSALNVYEEVYKALLSHGTPLQCAHVLARSARVQQQLELWDDAIKRYEHAIQIMRREGEMPGQAICLYQLSIIYRQQHDLQQALVYSQAAKELYDKLVDDRGLASAAHEQGHILVEMRYMDGALENFAESMRLCRRLGDLACTAGNLLEIGDVLDKLGKTDMAIRSLEEAGSLYEMLGAAERVDVLRMLEVLYEKQQRLADAVKRFKTAKRSTVKG